MSQRRASLILLVLTLLALFPASTAVAHGGGTPQLVQAPAGPYLVYAWTNPTPVRVGTLHVTIALTDPASNEPVLDVPVKVLLTPADGGVPVSAQATHDKATIKSYYETDLDIPSEGRWQATISFQAPQGSGEASFPVDVQPKSITRWLLIGVGGVVAVVIAWFFWPKKKAQV
jgi:hypothetical protein